MEKRIIQLETISALQDQTIEMLNRELFLQQKAIAKLQYQLNELEEKLTEVADSSGIIGNEKPPHY